MAKSNPGDSSSTSAGVPITPANFCSHCGHALRDDPRAVRGNIAFGPASAAFCCNCGAALDAAGRCPNSPDRCKFGGFTPHCS